MAATFSGYELATCKESEIFCCYGGSFLGASFFSEGISYNVSSGFTNLIAFFEFNFLLFSLIFCFFCTFPIFAESFTELEGTIGSFDY